jgi:methionyl-tRNA formyltransferase
VTGGVPTVFLGSGPFALPIAQHLAGLDEAHLAAVVSAPPRAGGRGATERATPVAAWAAVAGLPTLTPARLRAADAIAELRRLRPALIVLADYGQMVPPELLDLPPHGALNLHPSLLPRHRGASPIAATIMAGDSQAGVTLMRMDAGLDTGPIVDQRVIELDGNETAPELEARLAALAAGLLADSLPAWLAGSIAARPQPTAGATMTRPLRRADGRLDPARPAYLLERQVRAYQPWPGSYLETVAGRLIVWRSRVVSAEEAAPASAGRLAALATADGAGGLVLGTSSGALELVEVQPAGGRRMSGVELLRGRPQLAGSAVAPPAEASGAGSGPER